MSIKKISFCCIVLIFFFSCTTVRVDNPVSIQTETNLYEIYISDAQAGDAEAMVQVGISYEIGSGVLKDFNRAYAWYKKAASKGNSSASYRIARSYEYGFSVEQNWDSALEWYLSSAASGYSPALEKMILYYEDSPGKAVSVD